MDFKSVAVFCGSSEGESPIYVEAARAFGEVLALKQKTLVYGGAQVGCMGALANACLETGGDVLGVIPDKLMTVEIAHEQLTELFVVETMHERKAKMAELSDVFVAMPGGAGTLEEWFEVFTWTQLDYHRKPCCLLNVNGFFDPLIKMLEHTIEQGFMKNTYRDLIIVADDPDELFQKLKFYVPYSVSKW